MITASTTYDQHLNLARKQKKQDIHLWVGLWSLPLFVLAKQYHMHTSMIMQQLYIETSLLFNLELGNDP